MGPYQTIAPLESHLGCPVVYAVEGIARRYRADRGEPFVDLAGLSARGGAEAFLAASGARAVVRSTSDDVEGPNLEDLLTAGADALGIPVVVVEDFPGNFHAGVGRVEALCVEGEATVELHAGRGVERARIHATGNPRYDVLREVDRATRRARVRAPLGVGGDEPAVLWVGQPDGAASFASLATVVPSLTGVTLLFRAHPRDASYAEGRYAGLFRDGRLMSVDVTAHPDVPGLCCAADLVITQFSSVAVEAGYLGTPALFVLLPTLGGAYIRKQKGYAIPPWCKENCAFLLDDAKMAAVVVDSAMHDPEAREAVRVNFARRYASRPPSAPAVARLITARLER